MRKLVVEFDPSTVSPEDLAEALVMIGEQVEAGFIEGHEGFINIPCQWHLEEE